MLEYSPQVLQYFASFLAGGGLSEAGGRLYWVWWSGEGWVFIGVELHYDKVNCTYGGGEKTRNQTWRCSSDPLLAYHLKIPSDKNRALPCNRNLPYEMLPKSDQWEPSCSLRTGRRTDGHDMTKQIVTICDFRTQ